MLRAPRHAIAWFCRSLLAALLPAPERDRLRREHGVDPALSSFVLGMLMGPFGVIHFFWGGLMFMNAASADQGYLLLLNWWPGLDNTHFAGLGVINWFAWFLYPPSWPFVYFALCGVVRCVAYTAAREAVADPVVLIALRLVQHYRSAGARRERERRLGPVRPDRVIEERGAPVVLSCREKTDWSYASTIEMDGRFYRVAATEEREDGECTVIAYCLRELPPGAIIRRLVRFECPPSRPAAVKGK